MKIRWGDIILLAIVVVSTAVWLMWPAQVSAGSAKVQVGNEEVMTIDLSQDGLYPVQGDPGAGVLEVKSGQIRMQTMPREICPRGICCRLTGWIENAGQSIVCLPNKIAVTLTDSGSNYIDL